MPDPFTDSDKITSGNVNKSWRPILHLWLWGLYIAFGGIVTLWSALEFPFKTLYYPAVTGLSESSMLGPGPKIHWFIFAVNFIINGAVVFGIPFGIRWFRLRGCK